MFKYLKIVNDRLKRFDDWISSKNSRMRWMSVITVTFWMILFSTVLRDWFSFFSSNTDKDYIVMPLAFIITIPVYYAFLKYMAKRKKRNDSCS